MYAAAEVSDDTIVAPYLLPFEVANIIRKRMVRNAMSLQDAEDALDRFLRLRFVLLSPPRLHRDALILSDSFGLRAAYDAHYVVLAQFLGCDLWTDDTELIQVISPHLPYVRAIATYNPRQPGMENGSN
jgi:predicted nucleic acid-binding protein